MEKRPKKINWIAPLIALIIGVGATWGYNKYFKGDSKDDQRESTRDDRGDVSGPDSQVERPGTEPEGEITPVDEGPGSGLRGETIHDGESLAAVCPEAEPLTCPEPTLCPEVRDCPVLEPTVCPVPQPEIITVPKHCPTPAPVRVEVPVEKPWKFGCNVDWKNRLVAAVGDPDTRVICEVNWATRRVKRRIVSVEDRPVEYLRRRR